MHIWPPPHDTDRDQGNPVQVVPVAVPRVLGPRPRLGDRLPTGAGAFWSLCGAVASRLRCLASIFVARILGKESFGELGIIRSTVEMFGVLAGFALGTTATKHVAQYRRTEPERAGDIIALSGMVAVVTAGVAGGALFVLAPWLAGTTLGDPSLTGPLRVSCLIRTGRPQRRADRCVGRVRGVSIDCRVNLCAGLVSVPLLVAGTYFGGLQGAVCATAAGSAVNWALNHLALRCEAALAGIPLTFARWPRELPILWQFSVPAMLGGVMVGPITWACNALLVNRPNGYGEMGVYSAANQWFMGLIFLPGVLGQIVLPVLSERYGANDQVRSAKVLKVSIAANGITVAPLVIVLFCSALWSWACTVKRFGTAGRRWLQSSSRPG